ATIRLWDLTTGRPLGEPMTGHTNHIRSLVCTELNGRPVAISSSWDDTIRIWTLKTSTKAGPPLGVDLDRPDSIACIELDGRRTLVASGWRNPQMWDLPRRAAIAFPSSDAEYGSDAIAAGQLIGRPVAVAGSWTGELQVWDLTTRR